MKRLTFLLGIVLVFAISSGFAQKSSSFKKIGKLYETQEKQFFVDVFDTTKTGAVMLAALRTEMDSLVYECFLADFMLWAKFTQKHKGEKKFILKFRSAKEYETESNEYFNQFKRLQDAFVDNRLTWTESELKKFLTKQRLQEYITPVTNKFETRITSLLAKLRSNYKAKKKK